MPSLPPFFNGNISGILTVCVSDISWYKSGPKITHVLLEWNGSHNKDKLLISKFSKISYDIRTSYKSLLYYLSTCMLKCSVKCCENKTFAYASTKNLILTEGNQLVKTLPLIKNEEIVGILQLCFNLRTFNDTSFDNDIKYLTQFGIQNEAFNILNGNYIHHTEMVKPRRDARSIIRPISNSSSNLSSKASRSKEELACNYLMGKDMGFDEEEEALCTLKIMPSAEKIVETAEKTDIYSDSLSPLQIKGCSKMFTNIKPDVKNINVIQTNMKKLCPELNKTPTSKYNIYLQLTILSINIYHSIKSFQKNKNSTFIVQCFKDQEPFKMLRFMSRHLDNNVVQFKNATQSALLDGFTTKGITIKVLVRILSKRTPIVLGETKQMLDWDGFSATLDVCRCVKIPIWNNDKITGHLFISYEFSKNPSVQNYKENFSEIHVDDIVEINDSPEKEQSEFSKISIPLNTENKKKAASGNIAIPSNHIKDSSFKNDEMYPKKNLFTNKLSCDEQLKKNLDNAVKDTKINSIAINQKENQKYLFDKMYPEKDFDTVSQLSLNEWTKKEPVKVTKGVQTNFEVRQFNKSVQTHLKTSNVAVQVDSDELLEDPLDSSICCGVQNIFRCTHEFTLNIKKKCNATFNYVTYKFPECVTDNIGKVITCCRLFKTYGNTNILHLITLPTTIPLDTYLCNYYKKAAIVLNLHQSDNYSLGKVSLLVSHLIDMANEFTSSHVTKNFVLSENVFGQEPSNNKVCIELHYKKVYHSFPATKKSVKNYSDLRSKCNLSKNNSKLIVDLTESDSEDSSINKTYTLYENNNKLMEMNAQTNSTPVEVFQGLKKRTESNSTQTKLIPIKMIRDLKICTDNSTQTKQLPVKISCSLKTHTNNNSTQTEQMPAKISRDLKTRRESSSQTDPIPIKVFNNCTTQTELAMQHQCLTSIDVSHTDEKNIENASCINVPENQTTTDIEQKNYNFDTLNSSDIFKAKVIIVCGYDFPMVTLVGDTVPTAPTTYIIMKDHGEHTLSTSSVAETTNPVWNCEWTVELPKTKLIKGEWLLLQLWCKCFKDEYAGHDDERDMRLGFIIINVCALDHNKNGKLYDVFSDTEEYHGKVKVLISLIDFVDSHTNVCFVRKQAYDKTVINVSDKSRNSNDYNISEMLGEIKMKNSSQATFKKPRVSVAGKDYRCRYYVDLTVDSLQKTMIDPNYCNDTQTNKNYVTQQANKEKVARTKEENKILNEEYVVRNDNNWDCVDLTVDSLQKVNQIPFQSTAKSCLIDCFSNIGKTVDSGSISSVVSWTSSSNEILCSNNSWVTNIP